jgi:REP element-mobilizing transposase RayT
VRRNKLVLYVHLVWATWDRLPIITPEIERRLFRNIESEAARHGCAVLALNGTEDHVHLLVTIPATVTIANLVREMKGVSSHFVNDELDSAGQFKWQGSYGALTVSRWDVDQIVAYVKGQKEHHGANDLRQDLEQTFEEFTIPSA